MTTTHGMSVMRDNRPVKYVHEYLDRHGKSRIYLRRPRQPRVSLPGPFRSDVFWKAYHAAMAGVVPTANASSTVARGSVSEAVAVTTALRNTSISRHRLRKAIQGSLKGFG